MNQCNKRLISFAIDKINNFIVIIINKFQESLK